MDHLSPRDEKCPEHDTEPSTKNAQLPGHDQHPERLLGGPNLRQHPNEAELEEHSAARTTT